MALSVVKTNSQAVASFSQLRHIHSDGLTGNTEQSGTGYLQSLLMTDFSVSGDHKSRKSEDQQTAKSVIEKLDRTTHQSHFIPADTTCLVTIATIRSLHTYHIIAC